jgi:hypothetical protein
MQLSTIQLYNILTQDLGKEKAERLVTFVESKIEDTLKDSSKNFATKEDISRLELKIETKLSENLRSIFMFIIGAIVINVTTILGAFFMLANILKK